MSCTPCYWKADHWLPFYWDKNRVQGGLAYSIEGLGHCGRNKGLRVLFLSSPAHWYGHANFGVWQALCEGQLLLSFPSTESSPASSNLGTELPLPLQEVFSYSVTLQHTLQGRGVISSNFLFYMQQGNMGGNSQATGGQHFQQCGLPQPISAH